MIRSAREIGVSRIFLLLRLYHRCTKDYPRVYWTGRSAKGPHLMARRVCLAILLSASLLAPVGVSKETPAAASSCPATRPGSHTVPPSSLGVDPSERPAQRDWEWYGNPYLWTQIPPDGIYTVDRTMSVKVPWWRAVHGSLKIHGHRLGAPMPTLKPSIPGGYGSIGFHSTGITFPRTGCWRVTGTVAGHRLSYVVRVKRRI